MPYLTDLRPAELRKAASVGLPLFAAVGSVELHGSHMPLGTDLYITEGVIKEIEKRRPVIIAPPFVFSPTGYAVSGPEDGTADISVSCFVRYASEIMQNYERMGFKKIYVLVHHQSANISALLKTALLDYSMYGVKNELGEGWWSKQLDNPRQSHTEIVPAVLDTGFFPGHGGKGETEAMLAYRPETVCLESADPREYFWLEDVKEASPENAVRQRDELTGCWMEKLKNDLGEIPEWNTRLKTVKY